MNRMRFADRVRPLTIPKKVALDPDLVSNGGISQEMPELSTNRTLLFAISEISLLESFFASSG
jgi:hypothetical protein